MTGYQSKKNMAQDKMAHLTLEQRCRLSEQCLPEAPYRAMLTKLHDEMLAALTQPAQEPVAWMSDQDVGFKKSEFGATPTVPLYTTPPQRPWVGLTEEEAAECWTTSATQTWKNFEAKLKEKNNAA